MKKNTQPFGIMIKNATSPTISRIEEIFERTDEIRLEVYGDATDFKIELQTILSERDDSTFQAEDSIDYIDAHRNSGTTITKCGKYYFPADGGTSSRFRIVLSEIGSGQVSVHALGGSDD